MDREQDRADIAEAYIELHDELDKALAANAELVKALRRAANNLILAGQTTAACAARLTADRYAAKGA